MLGTSTSAVVTFEGPHVPFYIKAYGLFTRCRPYRQTVQCCSLCGELGHRRDVCPNPDAPVCAQCHPKPPHLVMMYTYLPTLRPRSPHGQKGLPQKTPPSASTCPGPGTSIRQAADLPKPRRIVKPSRASSTERSSPSPNPGELVSFCHPHPLLLTNSPPCPHPPTNPLPPLPTPASTPSKKKTRAYANSWKLRKAHCHLRTAHSRAAN
ncbi:hypothetical protein HPB48_018267 [Haemaphysalis longicornis]|uniref:CCHC-type domain-containing protein n=1 Tax=Haemaphysalis longicornis TaxID=44386 RepID=A0A9J6FXC2_HAELO|nr:hypothetical protein HPB48_018267 [Haemaphysalis longicornis]